VIPEATESAQPELLASLKNFLLSIIFGEVVLTTIVSAVRSPLSMFSA
jgi:hypothetical protein